MNHGPHARIAFSLESSTTRIRFNSWTNNDDPIIQFRQPLLAWLACYGRWIREAISTGIVVEAALAFQAHEPGSRGR